MADTEEYFPRGGKKPTTTYFKQNENFLGGAEKGEKKKKKLKKKSENDDGYLSDEVVQEDDVSQRICGIWFNYRVMKEGQLLLGRVHHIKDTCIHMSLPCCTKGIVMACHISEAYNKQLEAYVNDQVEQVCELSQMFRPGQYVAVKILDMENRKLMLSMMPQHINSTRTLKDLHKGALLQAAVSSVEDHGYVMDIGIPNTRAFLPKKAANPEIMLDTGALLWAVVKSLSEDSGVVTLSGELDALQKALQRKPAALLPGTSLEFTVDKPLNNGIKGHILDNTEAYIQRNHIDTVKGKKPRLGHKIRARLLFMVPPNNIPFLTMKNIFETTYPDLMQEQKFNQGDIIEEAQVFKVIARTVYLKLAEGSVGLLNLRRVAVHEDFTDEQVLLNSYPIGSTHRVRVTEYNLADYTYSVSDDPALIAEKYFNLSQLHVGDIVEATVTTIADTHMIVEVGRVKGFVEQLHMYESGIFVDPKKPTKSKSKNKKFKEGQVVKARVLTVDHGRNKVFLTLKPSLLDPELELLQSIEQAVVGKHYTGVIVNIKEYLLVGFFNNVKALVPRRFVSAEPLEDLAQAFHLGQIVKVIIVFKDLENEKLCGSLTENPIKRKRKMEDPEEVEGKKKKRKKKEATDENSQSDETDTREKHIIRNVGDILKATITRITDNYLLASAGNTQCYIPQEHMLESGIQSQSPNEYFEEGQEVKARVLVVFKGPRVNLTLKPTLLDPELELLQSIEQAVVGKSYTGVIVDIKNRYLLVTFFNNVSALVPKHLASTEPLEDLTQAFQRGQIVKCIITSVNLEKMKLNGSLTIMPAANNRNETNIEASKENRKKKKNKVVTEQIDENKESVKIQTKDDNIRSNVGDILTATITGITDYCVFASAGNTWGHISRLHMSESGIAQSESLVDKFKEGQEVKARVLRVDPKTNHVSLTLKPSLLDPQLELLQSIEQAVVGKHYTGVVVNIKDTYLLIAFFNNVTALVPKFLASAEPLEDLTQAFKIGQIVKCIITSVNLERMKLKGSLTDIPAVEQDKPTKRKMDDPVQIAAKKKKTDDSTTITNRSKQKDDETNIEESVESRKKKKIKNKEVTEQIEENNENDEIQTDDEDITRNVGDILKATITKVTNNYLLASAGNTQAHISEPHMFESGIAQSESPSDKFKVGQVVKGRVLRVDPKTNHVSLTLKPTLLDPELELLQSIEQAVVGKHYTGVVVNVKDEYLLIAFFNNVTALVSKDLATTEPLEDLTQAFQLGQIVKCIITSVNLKRMKLNGSLTKMPAKLTERIRENKENVENQTDDEDITRNVGDILKATITRVTDNYLLASAGKTRGHISGPHMFDSGIAQSESPSDKFKVGQEVRARVLRVDDGNRVALTLKPALMDPELELLQSIEQAVVGKSYTGVIVDIKNYLLIAFFNNIKVYVPEYFVSEEPLDDLTQVFQLGQIIKCFITSVDLIQKKLWGSLTCMKSDESENDSINIGRKGVEKKEEADVKRKEYSEESDAIETDVYDDSDHVLTPEDKHLIDLSDCLTAKQFKKKKRALQKCIQSKTKQIDDIDAKLTIMEEKGLNSKNKKKHSAKHAEKLILQQQIEKLTDTLKIIDDKLEKGTFSSPMNIKSDDKANNIANKVDERNVKLKPAVEVPSVKDFWSLDTDVIADKVKEEESSSSEEEEGEKPKKKRKKLTVAEKAAKAREEEERIREMEKRAIESENAPRSSDQFERALLAQPDCSQLWIAYIAFHLQATEIEKARAVGRKALNTINFREEGEKLNVWLALLNLEHRFGTKESQQKTLEDALQMNDKYEIHSKLLDILVETSKPQELVALVELMMRKYRRQPAVYEVCGEACFKASLVDKARQVMQKGIAALEKKEHVSLLVRFAQLERAHGDRERSEALFEQVLAVYPQRVDVCSAYIDMLLKAGDVDHVRQVMERMTSLQLPARKMKVLYKKWIEVEEKIGDPEHVESIRQRAMQFIEKAKF